MKKEPIQRNYVSPIDQFICQFDKTHPTLSSSQLKEKAKYQRIYYLRDVSDREDIKTLPEWF